MSYAVISDVHSNIEALDAVLEDIDNRKIESVLFTGDAVGYGPNPNEVLASLRERADVLIAGNHDWAAIGLADLERFNPNAREAVLWTMGVLSEESKNIIRIFQIAKRLEEEDVFLVHSSPGSPEEWRYLITYSDAEEAFRQFGEGVCFTGHSHHPFILERLPDGRMGTHYNSLELSRNCRYIINAGSVGQPRDRDPRACYVIFDGLRTEFVRVSYPVEKTQEKMRLAGLPGPLIERLSHGL